MDKFAVDLEKVLDDFEFNEGREESVIKNLTSHSSQKRLKPPASIYRRPAFEPINLSDADFSAASISTAESYIKTKEEYAVNNNLVYSEPFLSSSEYTHSSLTESKGNELFVQKENTINSADILKEPDDNEGTYSDGTPDLLDSNTLKPNQNNSNYTEDPNLNSQLPDITSVSNINLTPSHTASSTDETQPPFDLIKPTAQPIIFDEKLPPIVHVGLVVKDLIPDIEVKPITFLSVENDISHSDLEEYLHNLETDECIVDEKEETNATSSDSAIIPANISVDPQIISISDEPCLTEFNENELKEEPCIEMHTSKDETLILNEDCHSKLEEKDDKEEVLNEDSDSSDNNKMPESDNETLQSMCENIQPSGQKTSCISDLEIIPTQITEFKNIEESIPNEEIIKKCSNITLEKHDENKDNIVDEVTNDDMSNHESCSPQVSEISTINEVDNNNLTDIEPESSVEQKPSRPNSLALDSNAIVDCDESPTPTNAIGNNSSGPTSPMERLGKFPPFWVPDAESDYCMQCQNKFTVIRRRHHCRACGLVLCSKCCNLKAPLEYLEFTEARVCQPCFNIIYRVSLEDGRYNLGRQPNPNNPMEYCSTIPPLQQAASTINQPPPSVLVPTGVLKREGRAKSDVPKQVIFSDGIRPGGDLTELDGTSESRILPRRFVRRLATPPGGKAGSLDTIVKRPLNPSTQSFIPADTNLPPLVFTENGQIVFSDEVPKITTDEAVKFAINYNLFVSIKKVKLDCCVNRLCWSVCSEGLACVGQDEVAVILECLPDESTPPQDLFNLINILYQEASKGTTVSEMCFTPATNTLFDSKDHGGFLYIRPTFQCTTNLLLPAQPYLIAILVHRWETPWARLFPLRLVLRLGAEYRYYPCPLVSIRNRQPLYTDIGHTVMKVLVDFRKYSYSLAIVRGLLIHMEDRQTTILFPKNRYDQVVRALNNSNESVLAFGANLSLRADSHLVCIQGTKDENSYHTQAINIHNKPRRVTGASFVVFNGALKTAGLSGKSSIMEDGLMVHLPSDGMTALRTALREMQDYTISCGPNDEETVYLQWTDDDTNFNVGVKSCIDGKVLDGIPSIRVHNGTDYPGNHKIIRWTEVFILQSEDGRKATDPLDISRVSESLARATCMALVPDLDSLAAANLNIIAIRATIHPDCVGYEAGSCGVKLPSIYMKHLDEELVPVIHQAAVASQDTPAILELIFRVMNLT